jgi:hypothetical protein
LLKNLKCPYTWIYTYFQTGGILEFLERPPFLSLSSLLSYRNRSMTSLGSAFSSLSKCYLTFSFSYSSVQLRPK